MIIRNRRKDESLLRKIFGRSPKRSLESLQLLNETQFRFELVKEIFRSDRRHVGREFGLVRMGFHADHELQSIELGHDVFKQFKNRLRVTDSIGWYDSSLAFLLPETDREGTARVANALAKIALEFQLPLDTEISIYPIDDELIALSSELKQHPKQDDSTISDFPVSDFPVSDSPVSDRTEDGGWDSESEDPASQREPVSQLAVAAGRSASNGTHHNSSNRTPISVKPESTNGGVSLATQPQPSSRPPNSGRPPYKKKTSTVKARPTPLDPHLERIYHVPYRFFGTRATPWWKRWVDVTFAGTGLVLLSPVFLLAAIAVKSSSPGPIFFKQTREGKDGQPFGIIKFRTMFNDAERQQFELLIKNEQDGPAFKIANDPRVTRVGKYLRKSCIDELPQLVNVLLGQMSLVGPRPLPVHESVACTTWQRARLTVLPGLTCTWQAYGGRDVKFAQWMRMDLEYIEKQSFWFDLKLIFDTALIAIQHKGSV